MEYGPFPGMPRDDRKAKGYEVALFILLTVFTVGVVVFTILI